MVFSSLLFIFIYLPVTLLVYYIVPRKWRNIWLFIVNLVFYGWGEPVYVFLMLFSIALNYTAGIIISSKKAKGVPAKRPLVICIVVNLALLFFFKYFDFIAVNLSHAGLGFIKPLGLSLPIGISFYTFQTMSYPIDVYRGDAQAQKNFISFGTFVALFPQLIAGPIVRYKDIADQLGFRAGSTNQFASGVRMFVIGLGKKVLLANNIGRLWDIMLGTPSAELSVLGAWIGIAAFTLQIYFDFSGYSDMAIGLGRMLGFEFLKNFDYPYISRSATEFWRRWHMSLGTWFRDYVYIPLGGNRKGLYRQFLNIFIVWALTGIWHGASWNFLIWGIYYALLLMIEKAFLLRYLEKAPRIISHIYTLLIVMVGWAFFAIESMPECMRYLSAMFGGAKLASPQAVYYLKSYLPAAAVMIIAATPIGKKLFEKLPSRVKCAAAPVMIVLVLVLSTAYLVDSTYNPFLYFRF